MHDAIVSARIQFAPNYALGIHFAPKYASPVLLRT